MKSHEIDAIVKALDFLLSQELYRAYGECRSQTTAHSVQHKLREAFPFLGDR